MSTDTDLLFMAHQQKQLEAVESENKTMKRLLEDIKPVLKRAFFAHHADTKKADELYDKICDIVGKEV
ncbi:MAG: hypothetical protein K6G82_00750 [Ruminococcus sp.]|nr:hypothetical protein [Ruminococcus sp.]